MPEPLSEQGWQIIDEFNRAFAGRPASGYIAPVHITTAANSGGGYLLGPGGLSRGVPEDLGQMTLATCTQGAVERRHGAVTS